MAWRRTVRQRFRVERSALPIFFSEEFGLGVRLREVKSGWNGRLSRQLLSDV